MTTENHSPPAPNRSPAPRVAPSVTGPPVRFHELAGRDDEMLRIQGRLLGFASSEADQHQHHDPEGFARPGERCSACRWFEVRIFEAQTEQSPGCSCGSDGQPHEPGCGWEPARARFLVLTYGLSEVPGEVDKRRASWTSSAYEIIEFLTQRGRSDRQAFLPAASARALAQAANWSDEVQQAYIDRAVV